MLNMDLIRNVFTFGILVSQLGTVEGAEACDINHRRTSCPKGYCCARDEFILEDVLCKPFGERNFICTTVPSENECPCQKGLYCKPDVISSTFISIYGHCHNRTIDNTPTTTQIPRNYTIPPNFPPQIHLATKNMTVPNTAAIGTVVGAFTVTDRDNDTYIHCNFLQSEPYFEIVKVTPSRFEIKVLVSLRTLLPQTFKVHIDCEDGGDPPTNNIAQVYIQIVNNVITIGSTPRGSIATRPTNFSMATRSSESTMHFTPTELPFANGSTVSGNYTIGRKYTIGSNYTLGINYTIGTNYTVGTNYTMGNNYTIGNNYTLLDNHTGTPSKVFRRFAKSIGKKIR